MSGYDLHPEAFTDIDEIAIYLGEDSPGGCPPNS